MLLKHHLLELIEGSGLAPGVIEERGYASVDDEATLTQLGFPETQRRMPALVIPMYSPTGKRTTIRSNPTPLVRIRKAVL